MALKLTLHKLLRQKEERSNSLNSEAESPRLRRIPISLKTMDLVIDPNEMTHSIWLSKKLPFPLKSQTVNDREMKKGREP